MAQWHSAGVSSYLTKYMKLSFVPSTTLVLRDLRKSKVNKIILPPQVLQLQKQKIHKPFQ